MAQNKNKRKMEGELVLVLSDYVMSCLEWLRVRTKAVMKVTLMLDYVILGDSEWLTISQCILISKRCACPCNARSEWPK